MKWIAISIGILGVILTVKPFIPSANWLIRLGDFPRLQVLAVLLASAIFYFFYLEPNYFDYGFISVLGFCVIYQSYCIAPFTPFYPKEVQNSRKSGSAENSFSLLIFNVLMENENYEEVCRFIKRVNADVVLLAEPNKTWDSNLTEVKKIYKHKVSHILENHYGMMFFSNLEISDTEIQFLIQEDVPSVHTKIKLPSGDEIAFHGVHPRPPVPEEKGRSTERDGELLLVGKAIRESDHFPVYVKLSYEKDAVFKQKDESATIEEIEISKEKIKEALVENRSDITSEDEAAQEIEELKEEITKDKK